MNVMTENEMMKVVEITNILRQLTEAVNILWRVDFAQAVERGGHLAVIEAVYQTLRGPRERANDLLDQLDNLGRIIE